MWVMVWILDDSCSAPVPRARPCGLARRYISAKKKTTDLVKSAHISVFALANHEAFGAESLQRKNASAV
jgi:hypothetical protein